jgi:transcriptional regulator GlxA family with amidase domain
MIRQTDIALLDIALMYGFTSSSDFARRFKSQFGVSASEERRRVYIAGHPVTR